MLRTEREVLDIIQVDVGNDEQMELSGEAQKGRHCGRATKGTVRSRAESGVSGYELMCVSVLVGALQD